MAFKFGNTSLFVAVVATCGVFFSACSPNKYTSKARYSKLGFEREILCEQRTSPNPISITLFRDFAILPK